MHDHQSDVAVNRSIRREIIDHVKHFRRLKSHCDLDLTLNVCCHMIRLCANFKQNRTIRGYYYL